MNATKKLYRRAAKAYLGGNGEVAKALYAKAKARHGSGSKAKATARRLFEAAVKAERDRKPRRQITLYCDRYDQFLRLVEWAESFGLQWNYGGKLGALMVARGYFPFPRSR